MGAVRASELNGSARVGMTVRNAPPLFSGDAFGPKRARRSDLLTSPASRSVVAVLLFVSTGTERGGGPIFTRRRSLAV
jgi:hypothetical protein